MTTVTAVYDFQPSTSAPFQFQPTLDGQQYTAVVTWNLFGQRFYLNLYRLDGTRVLTLALVGAPDDYDLSLVAGYFTDMLVYRAASRQFEVIAP